jgi:hypothetical membrane protein
MARNQMSAKENLKRRLWAGPLAAILFVVGTTGLALLDPGYSQLRQTISEIGSLSSPLRIPFATLIFCVGICELVFASAVRQVAAQYHRSQGATYLIALSVVWSFGVAIFAAPDPLHGVFGDVGLVVLISSPIVFALSWRREPKARAVVVGSWILGTIVWAGIVGFTPFVPRPVELQPYVGVIQRLFLYSWMGWLALVGVLLRALVADAPTDRSAG